MTITSINHKRPSNSHSSLEVCLESAAKSNNFTLGNTHRVYHTRQMLLCAGDQFEGIYILRSGSAKAFISSEDGEEYITKFFYPGDLIGVDGFDESIHLQNITFLETSSVCFVKESDLNTLIVKNDDFRSCLLKSMSHTSMCDSSMIICLSSCSSEQKVARFILERAGKFASNGLSGTEFRLSMTRSDIANYLGMALETVSRIFASFQLKNFICVSNRQLSIVDIEALNALLSRDVFSNSAIMNLQKKIPKEAVNTHH